MQVSDIATARPHTRKGGGKPKGKLLRGHTYDHNPDQLRCGGSIPTRFQRILMPRDSTLIKPNNRLDDKYFYKSLFNKEPGPGSYVTTSDINDENPSFSRKGYGSGFTSTETRSTTNTSFTAYPEIGPGKYNPDKKATRKPVGKVFSYTGRKGAENGDVLKLNIPFDENNPLNYIKPITLNVYMKPTLPGPGEYDTNTGTTSNNIGGVSFKSVIERMQEKHEETPGVGYYFVNSTFGNYLSRAKSKSIERGRKKQAVTYEWLGDEAELVNKSYTEAITTKGNAEIVHYGKFGKVQTVRNAKAKMEPIVEDAKLEPNPMAAFVLSDMDRFGEQVRPKRPIDLKPGPGEYDASEKVLRQNLAGRVFQVKSGKTYRDVRKLPPGPAFYNPQKEPAKLSFHLNVNRKWI